MKKRQSHNSFLTLPQVQTLLGIKSRKTILKYIQAGSLPAYKLGGTRWRISSDDVDAFLRNQQVNGRGNGNGRHNGNGSGTVPEKGAA